MPGNDDGDAVWRHGLAWVEAERAQFALPPGPVDADDLFPLKVLSELARVAEVLARSSAVDAETRARLSALLLFAWQQFGEGRVFAELLAARPYAVLGTMYSIFEAQGWSHAETRRRLAILSAGPVSSRQFPPRQEPGLSAPAPFGKDAAAVLGLGLALAWRRMGLPSAWERQRLFPLTALSRRPPLAALSGEEAYSLTHVVFFVTDFGEQPEALDAGCADYLRARCPGWMEDERRLGNLDLYSELATALACAGETLPATVERVLGEARSDDGSVRGPGFRSRDRLATADDARRRFLERYHTTLAAMLASFAATVGLARGRP